MRLILFVAAGLLGSAAMAIPHIPDVKNGECVKHWRKQGFAAGTTLFDPRGDERYDAFYRRVDRGECWKEWLVLVYMAGNNDLSPYSFRDLWEMESVGSAPSVDVVVFHAHAREKGARYHHMARNSRHRDYRGQIQAFARKAGLEELGPREKEIAFLESEGQSLVASPALVTLPRADARDERELEAFTGWAMERYPSRRILFIAWGHGKGFDADPEDAVELMPVTAMTRALRGQVQTWRQGRELDIAGSDACLNQQVEFGYEWRGLAEYVFGSSTIVQKKGFNYHALLRELASHPRAETVELAKRIPEIYGGSVSSGAGKVYSSYYDPYSTMGVWTVAEMRFLKSALDDLGAALTAWIRAPSKDLDRIERALALRKETERALRLGGTSQDLQNLLQVLDVWARDGGGDRLGIRHRVREAWSALERSVLARFIGKKYVRSLVLTSKGVAIWLPASEWEFHQRFPVFDRSAFYHEASSWRDFVEGLYGDFRV